MINNIEKSLQRDFNSEFSFMTASGTASLIVALLSAKLPKDSGVIIPAICCPSVLSAVLFCGLSPVIADVDEQSFSLTVETIQPLLSEKISAIIAVHSYGLPCEIEKLSKFSLENNLFLIEDACLAIGNKIDRKMIGEFGDCAIFSFRANKIIDANGGGAIVTKNTQLADDIFHILKINHNFNYHGNKKEIIKIQSGLDNLQENIQTRIDNAKCYITGLSETPIKFSKLAGVHASWRLPAMIESRSGLLDFTTDNNIIITHHYPSLGKFRYGETLMTAQKIELQVINFFVHPQTNYENYNVANINKVVNMFFNNE